MIKINNKTFFFFMAYLFCFSLLIRYPEQNHPIGSDSFANVSLSNKILDNGNIPWFVNLFSLTGIYPFSISTGGLVLTAALCDLTGIKAEIGSFLLCHFVGFFGTSSLFIFVHKITENSFLSFSIAFIFSTNNQFLGWTSWDLSYRALFISLIPIYLFLSYRLFNIKKNIDIKEIFLLLFFLLCLITVHRMFFYLALTSLAFLLFQFSRRKLNYYSKHKKSSTFLFFFLLTTISFLYSISGFSYWDPSYEFLMEYDFIIEQKSGLKVLINMLFEYSISMGVLLPFSFIGFVYICFKNKTDSFLFIYLIIPFVMILCDIIYIKSYLIPFISILIGFGIYSSFDHIRIEKYKATLAVVLLLSVSALVPKFVEVRETHDLVEIESSFNAAQITGIYIKETYDSNIITFSKSRVIAFYSEKNSWTDESMEFLINDLIDEDYLNNYTITSDEISFSKVADSDGSIWLSEDWIFGDGPNFYPGKYKLYISENTIGDSRVQNMLKMYDTDYLVTDKITDESNEFVKSVFPEHYNVFSNDKNSIYFLGDNI